MVAQSVQPPSTELTLGPEEEDARCRRLQFDAIQGPQYLVDQQIDRARKPTGERLRRLERGV
jgi:hypothetical protein